MFVQLFYISLSAPSGGPTNVTVILITDTSIHLAWNHPPEDTHYGVIREYNINVTELETGYTFIESTDSETTEILLESLHPFYTYEVRISAVTVVVSTNFSEVFIVTLEAGKSFYRIASNFCGVLNFVIFVIRLLESQNLNSMKIDHVYRRRTK